MNLTILVIPYNNQYQTADVQSGQTIKLLIAPVNLDNLPNTYGHLYIEVYDQGVPLPQPYPFQAGPKNFNPFNFGPMVIAQYYENTLTDPSIDITSYISLPQLVNEYNSYRFFQNSGLVPTYDGPNLNSNSWISGLLLEAGIPESTIDGWVSSLQSASGKYAQAYGNGAPLIPCFATHLRGPLIQPGATAPHVTAAAATSYCNE